KRNIADAIARLEHLQDLRVDREALHAVVDDGISDVGADSRVVPRTVEGRRDADPREVRVVVPGELVRDERLVVLELEADDALDVDAVGEVAQPARVREHAAARKTGHRMRREWPEVPLRPAVEVLPPEVLELGEQLAEIREVETLLHREVPL